MLRVFRSEALLISSRSRRKLLATASDSSPGPREVEDGGVSRQCLGSCVVSPGELRGSVSTLCWSPGDPAPGENLALWLCLILFTQNCLVPPSLLPFALLGRPLEPLPDIPRPCHIWDSTDFLPPGLQVEGPGYCSDPDAKAKGAPIPSSRDGPRNLFIPSNFVSPAVANIAGEWVWYLFPDLAPPYSSLSLPLRSSCGKGAKV